MAYGADGCTYGYGDGATTGIILSDADTDTAGFQVRLERGENRLGIGVNKGEECAPSRRTLRADGYGPELPSNRRADHQRHGAGGGAFDGRHVGHRGRGRHGERVVQLPVACRRRDNRYRDYGRHGPDLHPSDADAGKSIKVRVTFVDDAGNEER